AAVATGSLPDPVPEWRTWGQTATVTNSTRQMQIVGNITRGGKLDAPTLPRPRAPVWSALRTAWPDTRHHDTTSEAISVALQPTTTIDDDSSGPPPSRTNGRNGPSV